MMDSGVMGSLRGGFSRRALARAAVGATSVATHVRRRPAEQNAFVPLSGRESLFSAWPEKSNQKRGHPDGAPSGHPALRVRGRVTGFFDGTSVCRRKTGRPPAGHPADFPPPARRAIGAPGRAARSRHALSEKPKCRELAALLLLARTMRARFSGVPSATVRRGRQGRAAGEVMDDPAFSRGQEPARKARPRLTDFPSMDGRKASPRGAVSLWLLSLWASKEKVARAPTGARNRFETCEQAEAKAPLTPTLSPNDEAVGGEGKLWDPASGRERVCSPRRMPPLIPSRSPSTTHPGNAAAWKETAPAPAAR